MPRKSQPRAIAIAKAADDKRRTILGISFICLTAFTALMMLAL